MKIFYSAVLATASLWLDIVDAAEDSNAAAAQGGLRGNAEADKPDDQAQRKLPEYALKYDLRKLQSKGGNPFDHDRLTGEIIVSRKSVKQLKKEGKKDDEIKTIRKAGMDELKKKNIVKESKGKSEDDDDFQVIKVGKGKEAEVIDELMFGPNSDLYGWAEPNLIHDIVVTTPNDPNFNSQWHHVNMESREAWDDWTGLDTVTVAICDTGLDVDHPDLQGNVLEGYNSVSGQWESQGGAVTDVHPHGTNCAGCAASIGDNGVGIAGVGWNIKHRPGRVTDSPQGSASSADLADCARRMCELSDVKVASVSYSGVEGAARREAATYCKNNDALMVNAAGNDSRDLSSFGNADADDLIVAAASDQNDNRSGFSAYGDFVDVWAPGTSVYTTNTGGGYTAVSGTSFSCPLTAGLIALIWSTDLTMTPNEVETILKQSSELQGIGNLANYGTMYGRINSKRAIGAALSGTWFPTSAPTTAAPTAAQQPTIMATHDGNCPRCTAVGGACDSGALLDGRGTVGPELNFPNTMDTCNDGGSGNYHTDESLDGIRVEAAYGGFLQVGREAVIKATVWAWSTGSADTADFYVTDNVGANPGWQYIGSGSPSGGGVQVITSPAFTLTSTEHAVRVNFRYNGSASSCSGGGYDDADDLVFAVAAGGPPVTASPVTASPVAAPTTSSPTRSPETNSPITASPTAKPVTASPITASPTAAPVTDAPTNKPVTASPVAACVPKFGPCGNCCNNNGCWTSGPKEGQCK